MQEYYAMHHDDVRSQERPERVKELDGLRALAILLVVAWHYLGISGGPDSVLWRIFAVGRSGVDLFFVLSGYLITGILLTNVRSPNYFRTFYLRRAFRILPIYYLMVAVYLVGRHLGASATVLFGGALPWWSYLVGLQNIWMATEQTYGAYWLAGTWSLAIEEQFYLLFPLVVYLVPLRALPKLLVAIMVLCPVGRIISWQLGNEMAYYVLAPLRADILSVGALIAWLQHSNSGSVRIRRIFNVAFWSSVCFFPIYAWVIPNSDFKMAIWGHTYLVAFYGSIVFVVLDRRGIPQLALLRSGIAAFFARISYALYLVHGCVLVLVFLTVRSAPTVFTALGSALTFCAFLLSIMICAASYRLIEAPLIKLAHRKFKFDRRPGATPAFDGGETLEASH
jgi:peptidoglycan/LPS O-acetylase OafA/YrhL